MDIALTAFSDYSLRRLVIVVCILMGLTACGDGASSSPGIGVNESNSEPTTPSQGQLPALDEPEAVLNHNSFLLTTNGTRLFKLSATTGEFKDYITFSDGIQFSGQLDIIDNTVFSTSDDNRINAIDLNTGELLWDEKLGNPFFDDWPTSVVCDSQTCWARGATGLLKAVAAKDGTAKWSTPLHPNGLGNENKLDGSDLLVTSDRIYLSIFKLASSIYPDSVAPAIMIIDRNDGSIIKRIDLEFVSRGVPSVIGNTLLISTWGEILAYDKNNFELLWRINDPALGYTRADVVSNVVVAGTYDDDNYNIVGFDLISGQRIWTVPVGPREANGYPNTTDGKLIYVMVGKGYSGPYYSPPGKAAMAIDPVNGSIVWFKDGLSFARNPLVALGHAYYGNHRKVLDENLNGNPDGLTSVNAVTGDIEWVNSTLDTPDLDWFTATPLLVHEGCLLPDFVVSGCNALMGYVAVSACGICCQSSLR